MKLTNLLLIVMLVPLLAQAKRKEPPTAAQVLINAPTDIVSSECVKLFVQRGFTLTSEAAHFLVFERKMSAGRAAFSTILMGSDGGDARDIVKLTLIPGITVTVVANYYIPGSGTVLDMSTDKKQKAGLQIALDIIKGNAERAAVPAQKDPDSKPQPGLNDPGFGGIIPDTH